MGICGNVFLLPGKQIWNHGICVKDKGLCGLVKRTYHLVKPLPSGHAPSTGKIGGITAPS